MRSPALVCATRPHGEHGAVVKLLTPEHGLLAAFVSGARGRALRPVVLPGNAVEAQILQGGDQRLPSARLELITSRGPWLSEPLPSAGIGWVTALTASALPEAWPQPAVYQALAALLDAICLAPSARAWAPALAAYETLLLRDLGYGTALAPPPPHEPWPMLLARRCYGGAHDTAGPTEADGRLKMGRSADAQHFAKGVGT